MHEGISQFGPLPGDKGHGHGQVIFAHSRLEIRQRLVFWLGLFGSPVQEQADHQTAEHAQDPQGVGTPDPAAVVIERDVQTQMGPVFDSPAMAIAFEPARGGKLLGHPVGYQPHGFVFAADMLAG